jgi:signal transduction histidine kinase
MHATWLPAAWQDQGMSRVSANLGSRAARYWPAVVAVVVAGVGTWLLWDHTSPQVSPLFLGAVAIAAWYGGLGPGLLAAGLGILAILIFFIDPFSLRIGLADLVRSVVFLGVSAIISLLSAQKLRAEAALRGITGSLELRVDQRTAELRELNQSLQQEIEVRRSTEDQLRAHQQRLRQLASELSLTEERQRRDFAARLHDDIGQTLALASVRLQSLEPDPAIEQVRTLLDETLVRTRTLTCELSPPALYQLGLEAGIAWLVEQTGKRAGLIVRFEDDGQPKPLGAEVRVLLFQAVRELLANIVKHAQAGCAIVRLQRREDRLGIEVEDDGAGFDPHSLSDSARSRDCFGLFNIRERLQEYDGQLIITSAPGEGARLTIDIALPREAADDE